jgi:mannose-6-phosphate isomerase
VKQKKMKPETGFCNRFFVMDNPIQTYAWGSHTAIAELLGRSAPSETPQAELWMGAHPKAPSRIRTNGASVSLADFIQRHPQQVLGEAVVRGFGPRLPFLFKVLAAARPLSIQAHPCSRHAREGFSRENRLGIPLDDPRRNYRDGRHKPECLCALTPFSALSGFRPIPDMLERLSIVWPDRLSPALAVFRRQPRPAGLRVFFETLLKMDPALKRRILEAALDRARHLDMSDPASAWVRTLHDAYPGDVGVFSPLMLNFLYLLPGEAVFLSAGQPHAYLEGVGMELMANSDNVLRGGLTPKHVDVEELLKVLDFTPRKAGKIAPVRIRDGESAFPTPAQEFCLSVVEVRPGAAYRSPDMRSIELLICLRGYAAICDPAGRKKVEVPKGGSVMVPAAIERYRIDGDATLYKASVPTPKKT